MGLKIYQVDAFTNQPFAGNPAAVCILSELRDDAWMQNLAREMNLSETAFLQRQTDGFNLRWFTPTVEVELCGHATLASAHILWEAEQIASDAPARFYTRSGVLTAQRQGDWIEMDLPAQRMEPGIAPPDLAKALGASLLSVSNNQVDYLVELESAEVVRHLQPDFALLKTMMMRGVIVTSLADDPAYDFVSRFFAPQIGIDEDPVTGAAHCCLGPFWRDRLGKDTFTAYQASARGGVVGVRCQGDRVFLSGQAVTILRGELD